MPASPPTGAASAAEPPLDLLWAAKLAHELNNALMAAHSNLDTMRLVWGELAAASGLDRPDRSRGHPAARWAADMPGLFGDLDESLKFISRIVGRMRALSQPPAEALARLNVQTVIRDALQQARGALCADIRVVRSPAAGSFPVQGDALALQQVLLNLFLNAARAMKGAGGRRVLSIRVARRPGRGVTIAVSDTGPGVRPADRDRLFQPFFTTCRDQGGTGLGLFISREIMRRHGGDLVLGARPGPGATFILSLPSCPRAAH